MLHDTRLIQYPWGRSDPEYTIPITVTHIAKEAFRGSQLNTVLLPDGLVSIDQKAFEISALTSITIPNSVESIGEEAFSSCKNLATVTFGDDSELTHIAQNLFKSSSSLEHITIPDSVVSIGHGAFYGCTSLETVVIPSSVKEIGWYAFYNCENLTGINPVGVENTLLEGLETIGTAAFAFCTSLESIILPSTLMEIGTDAFIGCSELRRVDVDRRSFDGITAGGDGMFYECHDELVIYVPDLASEAAYRAADNWKVFAAMIHKGP